MTEQLSLRRHTGFRRLVAACILTLVVPVAAEAQSAAVKYQRAMAREKAARASKTVTPAMLRAVAKSYEAVTRAHPASGYADNALWQAAGVMGFAYERFGQRRDLDQATSLLRWLKKEYPTGSLARQVETKLAALPAPARATTIATAATTAAAPAGPPTSTPVVSAAAPKPAAPAKANSSAGPTAPPVRPGRTPSPAPASASGETPAVVSIPLPPSAPATSVRAVTHSKLPKGDRLTIELSSEGAYATTRVANPDRVIVDLANATMLSGVVERAGRISGTLLKSINVVKGSDEAARFVLEVAGTPRYSTFPLYNPFRLVLDVESESADVAATTTSSTPQPPSATSFVGKTATTTASVPTAVTTTPAPTAPASTSRGDYSLARQLGLGISRIVIDPGHGGHDPGARANGVTEAELVLDIASRVAALLSTQSGFDVILTRRTDEFIPLEERTAIANREKADMFISIHANASPQVATRGIETYFLDFATTPQAEALAARENASSAQTMRLLPELVRTIALSNKADESRELARSVQTSLVRRLAPEAKGMRDLGVKRAPFVVLIGAQMPSVLAEVSFVTNRADAALLKQSNYRQRIAQALADAILKYKSSLKKVGTVATAG